MNIDTNTGLPELPEGHFWRVTTGFEGMEVQWRKPTWYGSKVVGSTEIDQTSAGVRIRYSQEITPEDVLHNAKYVYKQQERYQKNRNLLGDYPPKKLYVPKENKK